MHDERPEPSSANRASFGWVLWVCFVLLVVYPLSIGPAARLYEATSNPTLRNSIYGVYTPIILLCDACDPVEEFFEWYLEVVWDVP
jgi:hypothetical protein